MHTSMHDTPTSRHIPIPLMKGMQFLSWAWSAGTLVEGALSAMRDNVLLWCVEKIALLCVEFEGSSFDLPPKKREKKRKKSSRWREPWLNPLTMGNNDDDGDG